MEEMNRVSAENKKLTEMLTVMCENYNALRGQLTEYMSKNSEKELLSASRKRKSESSNTNNVNGVQGNSESSSTDEELPSKKPREETIKAKISKAYVRTEASDSSLVSLYQSLSLFLSLSVCVGGHKMTWFSFVGCEGWISMEEIWSEGDQRQSLS